MILGNRAFYHSNMSIYFYSRLGTGTNLCYVEDINKIHTISDQLVLPPEAKEMIINIK